MLGWLARVRGEAAGPPRWRLRADRWRALWRRADRRGARSAMPPPGWPPGVGGDLEGDARSAGAAPRKGPGLVRNAGNGLGEAGRPWRGWGTCGRAGRGERQRNAAGSRKRPWTWPAGPGAPAASPRALRRAGRPGAPGGRPHPGARALGDGPGGAPGARPTAGRVSGWPRAMSLPDRAGRDRGGPGAADRHRAPAGARRPSQSAAVGRQLEPPAAADHTGRGRGGPGGPRRSRLRGGLRRRAGAVTAAGPRRRAPSGRRRRARPAEGRDGRPRASAGRKAPGDTARGRGGPPGRRGPDQPGDRPRLARDRADGGEPRGAHPGQAGLPLTGAGPPGWWRRAEGAAEPSRRASSEWVLAREGSRRPAAGWGNCWGSRCESLASAGTRCERRPIL